MTTVPLKNAWRPAAALALALLVAAAIFYPAFGPGRVLFTTDDNIGAIASAKRLLSGCLPALWNDSGFVGMPSGLATPNWTSLLAYVVSAATFVNCVHALDLVAASVLLALFLLRKANTAGACVGMLAAFWLGSNLTLVYAGHVAKYGVLLFAALTVLLIDRATARKPSVAGLVLAGAALGLMFLEQQDLALFFGMFLGGYTVLRLWRAEGASWPARLAALIAMGIVALAIAGPTLLGSYFTNVKGVAAMNEERPEAKWEFCTQWSVPPDETIDLLAPGYTGWRSGDPEGPYWGRTGQSAGWERTRQGFMNFRLESIYLGAIPLVFALFAVCAALFKRAPASGLPNATTPGGSRPGSERRAEVLFWGATALVALLLAYGKYFPLYALFYQLPLVNNIRNPNKFLQVFQLAVGILAAYGLDEALRTRAAQGNSAGVRNS